MKYEDTINEKIELNKELTKKEIAAILATMIGQLSAISTNAISSSSMYTAYVKKAIEDVKRAEASLKNEKPKYTQGVNFKLNESFSKAEKEFADWLRTTNFERQAKYYNFDSIWPAEFKDGLTLCMNPLNDKEYDASNMIGWNTKTGEVTVDGNISKEQVKAGKAFLSKVWQKYKSSKNFNY